MSGKKYIIYNPHARMGKCKDDAEILEVVYDEAVLISMEKISSFKVFFEGLEEQDEVILCGGDGTLSAFANAVKEINIKHNIYFYSVGYGDDFVRDLGFQRDEEPDFLINSYIEQLPTLIVNGKERLFINGIGFGVDSDCWKIQKESFEEDGAERGKCCFCIRLKMLKDVFLSYQPTNASIYIDGEKEVYEKVWMAPIMFGRYYNEGLLPAPNQKRTEKKRQLSLMLLHGCGRWKAFVLYLCMYKGKHEKFEKYIKVLKGNDIRVSFNRPASLVVDGDILNNISEYHASISQ